MGTRTKFADVVNESTPRPIRGWVAFGVWVPVGALWSVAIVVGWTGALAAPFALAALIIAATWAKWWPECLGCLTGLGITLLSIAYLHREDCAWRWTCGSEGLNPLPWAFSGAACATAGAVSYLVLRRRPTWVR